MSKKPKRSRHRIPLCALEPRSEPVTPEYQAEVDASMDRLERRYRKAQKALEAAEARAERARVHAAELERKQQEQERVATNRAAEEQRANEYIERIKDAAKNARVAEARARLEAKHRSAVAQRDAATAQRKADGQERVQRAQAILAARTKFSSLEIEVAQRRRELHEIELLMMPGNYAGRDHRGRGAPKHTAGSRS
jgi:hypothetical protein